MTQFDNALTIINFKKEGLNFDSFIKKHIIESTKKSVSGLLSDIVSSVGIVTDTIALGYVSEISQELLDQEGINEDSLDFYQFKINPTTFNFPRSKIINNILTGGGWDSDVRGQNIITVSYSATTGSLVPKTINNVIQGLTRELVSRTQPLLQTALSWTGSLASSISPKFNELNYQMSSNPKLSTRYLKFLLFDTFWRANDDDLLIIWEDNAYIGKFVSFDFKPDANKPWEIQYNFTIAVYPDFTYNIYTGSILNDLERIERRFNLKNPSFSQIFTQTDPSVQASFDWFSDVGQQPYNKDVLKYIKNNSINTKISTDLTPEELAKAYRTSGGDFIDIFEEQFTLNLIPDYNFNTQFTPGEIDRVTIPKFPTLEQQPEKEREISENSND